MNVASTKYTAHYENGIVVAQWISIEMALDGANGESALDALDRSQELVQKWYASKQITTIGNSIPPGPPTELPVINKAEERLAILIENASTKEELMKYKDNLTSQYLANVFSSKLLNFKQ
jgi:hypothetical protein